MKKIRLLALVALCSVLCMGAKDIAVVTTNAKTKVVMLTPQKWSEVKHDLDTKGIVKLEESNVVLVITNGIPNVEHWFLDARMPIEFCGYGNVLKEKPVKPIHQEPGGYQN